MDKVAIFYHDIFDYPLMLEDLDKWKAGKNFMIHDSRFTIQEGKGYFFIKGKADLISKRIEREKASQKKLRIAERASKIISFIPTVKMVAVTGSLAMMNSGKNRDIDLMIVTRKRALWTTRLFVYLLIWLFGIGLRRPNNKQEKDRLCINIWLDESDIAWSKPDRNLYTAHEIAQIVSLVNKDETYEKFLWKNKWILEFWPQSVKIQKQEAGIRNHVSENPLFMVVEKLAFKIQYLYMKNKISRETITPTRALFHPHDWGKTVLTRLGLLD